MKFISQIFRKFLNRLSIIIDIIFFGIKNDLKQEASIRTAMRFLVQKFKKKEISVLEIGTRFGDSAKVILKTLNIKKYIIIDPFISYEDYKIDDANKIMKNGDEIFNETKIKLEKLSKNVIFFRKFSNDENTLNKIEHESLDFIFIDGNHEYKYVLEDLRNYYPKLKSEGVLIGDDFNHRAKKNDFLNTKSNLSNNKGVYEAVEEFSKEHNITYLTFGRQAGYPKLFCFKKL